ncbi:hypothetical protein D3C73_1333320 [compost metagenome]
MFNVRAMNLYAKKAKYTCEDETIKYGVMDYYRVALNNVATLTIELSRLNGNPIGPFADPHRELCCEFNRNIKAIFFTLDNLN